MISILQNFKKNNIFAIILIGVTMFALWNYAKNVNFLPCISNCGETLAAEMELSNFKLYGLKYGLLEDHATSNDIKSHPFLYTHNVSIPSIVYPLLDWVGLKQFWSKQLFTLFIFGLGLFYIYHTSLYFTRSYLIANTLLLFFCTDYYHVFSFGLNALRAWHWLILFGLLFHSERYFSQRAKSPGLDRIFIIIYAILSFGIGYDFWIICLFTTLTLYCFAFFSSRISKKNFFYDIIKIIALFLLPVILRQIHVASTLGLEFWSKDFIYSSAIKIPFLKGIITLPSMSVIDKFYSSYNVLRAPASQAPSWSSIFQTLSDMILHIIKPSYGSLSIWNITIIIITILIFNFFNFVKYTLNYINKKPYTSYENFLNMLLERIPYLSSTGIKSIKGGIKLLFILSIGACLGLAVFAPFSLHVYLKHQFPLLAAPILLAKTIIFFIFSIIFIKLFEIRSKLRWASIPILSFILLDHLIIQFDNVKYFKPTSTRWIPAIKNHQTSSFATSWIPDGVAAYTTNWVVAINSEHENKIIKKLQKGKNPFEYSNYILFGQKDVTNNKKNYLQPDYWLYYVTDQSNQFDRPAPICYRDYISKLIGLTSFAKPKVTYIQDMGGGKFGPGGYIVVTGLLSNSYDANINKIELMNEGNVLMSANYNCLYGTFYAVYRVPSNYKKSALPVTIVATHHGNIVTELAKINFQNVPDAKIKISDINPVFLRHNQMDVNETISALQNIPIIERGKDYVIFDLHNFYKQIK